MKRLPRLRPGDTIGVAALSGPCKPELLDLGRGVLERHGYGVRLASNVGRRCGALSLSGSDGERLQGYRDLLLDPEVRAIFFTRGGYGAGRIVRFLDPAEVAAHPKIHCGFSDLTVLSSFLLTCCGLPSFHGPMVAADLPRHFPSPGDPALASSGPSDPAEPDALTAEYFPAALEGRASRELPVPGADVLVPGAAEGRLVGGCLSILAASIGWREEFDYEGAILILEDVAEEAYRIDRMLLALEGAGRFAKLEAVLIGSLSNVTFGGSEDPARLRQLLLERLAPLGIPVATGLPFGHRGPNPPLPLGARVAWDGERATLTFVEEIVA